MKLVSAYRVPDAEEILYSLLAERTADQSISHTKMPTMEEHRRFFQSRPYTAWYLIDNSHDYVGAIYLTRANEIGVFVFKAHQGKGIGQRAVEMVREAHPGPHLWNVNPANKRSIALVERLGGRLIQLTYRF